MNTLSIGRALIVMLVLAAAQGTAMIRSPEFAAVSVVGCPDLGYALITLDARNAYAVVGRGEFTTYGMRATRITPEGATLSRIGVPDRNVPILGGEIPFDIFMLAMATLYQRSIIVGTGEHLPRKVPTEVLVNPAMLADYCKQEGLDLRVFDDCMLLRPGSFPADLKAFGESRGDKIYDLNYARISASRVHALLQSQIALSTGDQPSPTVSLRSFGLSRAALLYYLDKVTRADFAH